jgi:16S rRNA (cytidine1402-2'-O)-methyltransferase
LLEWYGQNKPRGEFTLLVEGAATSSTEQENPAAEAEALSDEAVLQAVNKLIASGVNKKDAIKMTASSLELPRRRVYQLVIKSD